MGIKKRIIGDCYWHSIAGKNNKWAFEHNRLKPIATDYLYTESLKNISSTESLGNFNCGDINWSSISGNDQFSQKFGGVIFELNLFQLIDESSYSSGYILDLVLPDAAQ